MHLMLCRAFPQSPLAVFQRGSSGLYPSSTQVDRVSGVRFPMLPVDKGGLGQQTELSSHKDERKMSIYWTLDAKHCWVLSIHSLHAPSHSRYSQYSHFTDEVWLLAQCWHHWVVVTYPQAMKLSPAWFASTLPGPCYWLAASNKWKKGFCICTNASIFYFLKGHTLCLGC